MSKITKGFNEMVNKAQVNSAARSLETRYRAKSDTISKKISQMKEQRENILAQIGRRCYELYGRDEFHDERFNEFFEMLTQNETETGEQERLLETLKGDLEAEMRLIRGEGRSVLASCPKCGSSYNPGVQLFCSSCGEDLRNALPKEAESSKAECPDCKTPYEPSRAKFCKKCGRNLTE